MTGSALGKKARDAARKVTDHLRDLGEEGIEMTAIATAEAAHLLAEEARALGTRAQEVAQGALAGVWKGAKGAFRKGKNE